MRAKLLLVAGLLASFAVLAFLEACSGDDPVLPPAGVDDMDAAGGDGAAVDASGIPIDGAGQADSAVTGNCDLAADFGVPERLDLTRVDAGAGAYHVMYARPSPAGTLFASSLGYGANPTNTDTLDLFLIPVGAPPSTMPTPLGASAASARDAAPTLLADGKTALFDRATTGGNRSLFQAGIASGSGPARVVLSGVDSFADPYVVGDHVYYTASASGVTKVVRARYEGGKLVGAADVDGLGSDLASAPVVTPDEKTIYFAVAGNPPKAGTIWRATRADVSGDFTDARPLTGPINGLYEQAPTAVSADGCELYLHARASTSDYFRAYRAKKPSR